MQIYKGALGIFKNYFPLAANSNTKWANNLIDCAQELHKIFANQYVYFVFSLYQEIIKDSLTFEQLEEDNLVSNLTFKQLIEQNIEIVRSIKLMNEFSDILNKLAQQ